MEEVEKEKEILAEPDMSEEEERNSSEEIDEMSLAGNISGPMAPLGLGRGTTGVPDSRATKKKKRK